MGRQDMLASREEGRAHRKQCDVLVEQMVGQEGNSKKISVSLYLLSDSSVYGLSNTPPPGN
jgi:hypothetical protein